MDDDLFKDDLPDRETNACINAKYRHGQATYMRGYAIAASKLASSVEADRGSQDLLIYPIAYLYRHAVELFFKDLIPRCAELSGSSIQSSDTKKLISSHELNELWQILQKFLPSAFQAMGEDITLMRIEAISNYVTQLAKIDPSSLAFRYSETKSGAATIPDKLTYINLPHFCQRMDAFLAHLEGIHLMMREYEKLEAELSTEYDRY